MSDYDRVIQYHLQDGHYAQVGTLYEKCCWCIGSFDRISCLAQIYIS